MNTAYINPASIYFPSYKSMKGNAKTVRRIAKQTAIEMMNNANPIKNSIVLAYIPEILFIMPENPNNGLKKLLKIAIKPIS